jgi:subtilisin family serine protease
MQFAGHIMFTLRTGESFRMAPNQMDYLLGAARPSPRLDGGGRVDAAIQQYGGGGRALGVFPSRFGLGRVGEHGVGYDEDEERHGLSRTYQVQVAEAAGAEAVCDALRQLDIVESASMQTLSLAPLSIAPVKAADARREPASDAVSRMRIPEAQAIEPGDEDVLVGVVDTGVALGHPELQRKCLAGYNTVDLGLGQLNAQLTLVGDSWGVGFHPEDQVGHGSMVAGIIGAHGWHTDLGVAMKCLMVPVRVLAAAQSSPNGHRVGVGSLCNIDAGLKVCCDLGADVINMSFGTPESAVPKSDPRPHERVIQYALERGCTLVAAAGNKGDRERYYPAALPGVIAVGSVDARDARSTFSSYGGHVALCAPGEAIRGLAMHGYTLNSGTSFAAPFVSGVAALVLSRARRAGLNPDGNGVKKILTESARPLAGGGFHPETGYGLVDALAAMRRVDALAADSGAQKRTR